FIYTMYKLNLTAIFISLFSFSLNAQHYLPSATPDRINLTWQTSPATSQAVSWRTDVSVKGAIAQITEAIDAPDLEQDARTFEATTTKVFIDSLDANYHSVNFTGLKPATMYTYRVGSEGNFSEWLQFTTASDKTEPFSFIYLGDAQNQLKSHWSRVI